MFIIFGNDDDIFIPEINATGTIFGSKIIYTEPNYANFLSSLGFHIPLNGNSIPYTKAFVDKFPYLPSEFERSNYVLEYLHISPEGDLWIITLNYYNDKKTFVQNEEFIFRKLSGWWVLAQSDELKLESPMLAGFLNTNPDMDDISKFCFERLGGIRLKNFKITELIEKYNRIDSKYKELEKENSSET